MTDGNCKNSNLVINTNLYAMWGEIKIWLRDFVNIILPKLCLLCEKETVNEEEIICLGCMSQLPYSRHWDSLENDFTRRLGNRFRFETGAALFIVKKGEGIQNLIQMLKYKDREDIGHWLGSVLGHRLADKDHFKEIDMIIPVPLHPKKLKKRGYNQSVSICRGLAESLQKSVFETNLVRVKNTVSQTTMNKEQRLSNIEGAFSLQNPEELKGKHILLVDDVLTTGATLESCALALLGVEGVKVSLATAGLAEH